VFTIETAGKRVGGAKSGAPRGAHMTTAHAGGLPERWDAVLEHRDRAFRVARARLSNPYDVDDCVQEGMARVVAMPNLDLDRVGPLLSTVVANVATDTHRKHSRSSRLQARLTGSVVTAQVHDEPVCDAAEARWLHTQLGSLAPRERAVLELRAEGRTVAQTAAALGMTYKAVESAFTRGRTALKDLWRATLAGIGALVTRAWRAPDRAAGTAVLAAAVSLAGAAIHLSPLSPAGPGTLAGPATSGVTTTSYPSPAPRVVADLRLSSRTLTRARPPRNLPRARTVAAVQAPTAGKLQPARVSVTREHDRESLPETLQRCVRNGVTVSPSEISCRG
jgi:RNA polymerase sigma factor (sigma-70 family)